MSKRHTTVDAGKKYERQVAAFLGGKRKMRSHYGQSLHDVELPLTGGRGRLMVECKLTGRGIAVERWMEQAEKYATGASDMALVVCKEKGKHLEDSLAVLRLGDLRDLLGGGGGRW